MSAKKCEWGWIVKAWTCASSSCQAKGWTCGLVDMRCERGRSCVGPALQRSSSSGCERNLHRRRTWYSSAVCVSSSFAYASNLVTSTKGSKKKTHTHAHTHTHTHTRTHVHIGTFARTHAQTNSNLSIISYLRRNLTLDSYVAPLLSPSGL